MRVRVACFVSLSRPALHAMGAMGCMSPEMCIVPSDWLPGMAQEWLASRLLISLRLIAPACWSVYQCYFQCLAAGHLS